MARTPAIARARKLAPRDDDAASRGRAARPSRGCRAGRLPSPAMTAIRASARASARPAAPIPPRSTPRARGDARSSPSRGARGRGRRPTRAARTAGGRRSRRVARRRWRAISSGPDPRRCDGGGREADDPDRDRQARDLRRVRIDAAPAPNAMTRKGRIVTGGCAGSRGRRRRGRARRVTASPPTAARAPRIIDPDSAAQPDDEPARHELLELASACRRGRRGRAARRRGAGIAPTPSRKTSRLDTIGEAARTPSANPAACASRRSRTGRPEAVRPEADDGGGAAPRASTGQPRRDPLVGASRLRIADGDQPAGEERGGESRRDRQRAGQRIREERRREERDQEAEQRGPGLASRHRDDRPRHDDAGQACESEVHGAGD